MRYLPLSALVVALAFSYGSAEAKGCLKGAAVGGVAGHVAGHHGILGAAAGCAVGHHETAQKAKEEKQASQKADGTPQTQTSAPSR